MTRPTRGPAWSNSVDAYLCWTRTGQVLDRLDIRDDWSYSEAIAWASLGKGRVTVPLRGRQGAVQRPALKAASRAMSSMTICLATRDSTPRALWAGIITSCGWGGGTVNFGLSSVQKLLDKRMLIKNPYWGTPVSSDGNLHFELVTRDLVLQLLTEGTSGFRRDLPIVIPAQSGQAGGIAVDYVAADLRTVFEAITDVVKRDDGPDVVLRPELYQGGDYLRWYADVGNPGLGTAPAWTVDTPTLPTWHNLASVLELSGDRDDSETVSTAYVVGGNIAGTNIRLIGTSVVDRGDPLPALECADRTTVSETNQDQLDALATSYGQVHSYPTESWSMAVLPGHQPRIFDEWSYGDAVGLQVEGHDWLDDGLYTRRVVGVTHTEKKLDVETTDGSEVGMPRYVA